MTNIYKWRHDYQELLLLDDHGDCGLGQLGSEWPRAEQLISMKAMMLLDHQISHLSTDELYNNYNDTEIGIG